MTERTECYSAATLDPTRPPWGRIPPSGSTKGTDIIRTNDSASVAQPQVIEDFGLAFEAHGLPRMAGRILGRLLMCDPPHQSMDQLVDTLGASKGSVSSMTRLLIDRGVIERLSLPGDRHDYFRTRTGSMADMFGEHAHRSIIPLLLLEKAMEVADDRSAEGLARLRDAHDFLAFMQRELPALLQRWDTLRSQGSPSQKEDE